MLSKHDGDGDGDDGVAQHGGILQITSWQRHVALVYRVLLWYWTSMLWSINTCQNKVVLLYIERKKWKSCFCFFTARNTKRANLTWLSVTLSVLDMIWSNLQRWRQKRWSRKFTVYVRFRPIRKEMVSSRYNNHKSITRNSITIFAKITLHKI